MLMDNMAYLQQIAGVDNSMKAKANQNSPFSKFLNVWTFVGLGIFIVLIIGVALLAAALNKVDTKDQDLMQQSYWRSRYIVEETMEQYSENLKNSDIRDKTSSLKSVLNEIMLNSKNLLLDKNGFDIESINEDDDPIAVEQKKFNTEFNTELENARLNGILDRIYIREVAMQIAYLRSYQSEIVERTKDDDIRSVAEKAKNNLDNLYDQFQNFNSLMI